MSLITLEISYPQPPLPPLFGSFWNSPFDWHYTTHFQNKKLLFFKKYYSSPVEKLVLKLPKSANNFGTESVNNYHKKHNLKEKLIFAKIKSDKQMQVTYS